MGNGTNLQDIPFHEIYKGDDTIREYKKKGFFRDTITDHQIFYNEFNVQDNIDVRDEVDETDGYIIPASLGTSECVPIKPRVAVYGLDKLFQRFSSQTTTYPVSAAFIKDFDIQAVMPHTGGKDENDTDTEYEFVINNNYVNKMDDITFKICT